MYLVMSCDCAKDSQIEFEASACPTVMSFYRSTHNRTATHSLRFPDIVAPIRTSMGPHTVGQQASMWIPSWNSSVLPLGSPFLVPRCIPRLLPEGGNFAARNLANNKQGKLQCVVCFLKLSEKSAARYVIVGLTFFAHQFAKAFLFSDFFSPRCSRRKSCH
jgi:hypothetical protein